MIKRDKGQENSPEWIASHKLCSLIFNLLANISTRALAFLPFILAICSCSSGIPEDCRCEIAITKSQAAMTQELNLFFYDEGSGALDSYQRFTAPWSGTVSGASRTGKKKVVAIANMRDDRFTWTDIKSIGNLEKVQAVLDEDDPERPAMSGIAEVDAGKVLSLGIGMEPVMSEVVLKSIRCDFKGRPYEGEEFRNIKVYLTNVSTRWPVLKDTSAHATEYMNVGRRDSSSMARLAHPEYLFREIGGSVGSVTVRPDIHLFCYPNVNREESMGTPFTRLVIEGELQGRKYYYPLNVNRKDDESGVARNCVYVFDVTLTRRGTLDPDTAIDVDAAKVEVTVTGWNEKTRQYVSY